MLNISETFANAGKHAFQNQLALLQKIGNKAFESTQKIIALNISTTKTILGDHKDLADHWIHSKQPYQFITHEAHEAQPGLHHLFNYERELAHILTNAQAEMLTFAFSEIVELQNDVTNLSTHLHQATKDKQEVVKQAAHAYSAEIKSLYPQAKASSTPAAKAAADKPARAKAKSKPLAAAKPAAKAAKAVAKTALKAAAKPVAKASAEIKAASKPVAKAEVKTAAKAVAKPAAKVKTAVKPVAKAEVKPAERKAAAAELDFNSAVHASAENAARPPMPRPGHALEVHSEAPAILNLDDQVVE